MMAPSLVAVAAALVYGPGLAAVNACARAESLTTDPGIKSFEVLSARASAAPAA